MLIQRHRHLLVELASVVCICLIVGILSAKIRLLIVLLLWDESSLSLLPCFSFSSLFFKAYEHVSWSSVNVILISCFLASVAIFSSFEVVVLALTAFPATSWEFMLSCCTCLISNLSFIGCSYDWLFFLF